MIILFLFISMVSGTLLLGWPAIPTRQQVEATRYGECWRYTPVVGFSATEGKAGPAPLRGEHTRPVLKELGYTDDQIQDYKQRGIVDWEEA